MRIAITGATGNIGKKLAQILLDQGNPEVVLLVRDAAKAADLTARGAIAIEGDLEDPIFLTEATKFVDALFFMIPPKYATDNFRGYQNVVIQNGLAAVRANDIKHVVLLSSVGAQHAEGTGPIAGLYDAEVAFRDAGVGLTILRPAYFMENFLWSTGTLMSEGAMYLPMNGDFQFPMIATQDIALEAAKAIAGPAPTVPLIRELAGPEDVSFREAALIIETESGKPIQHVQIPFEAAKAYLLSTGASEDTASKFIEMYQGYGAGLVDYELATEERTRTSTKFEDFARNLLIPAMRAQVTA